MLDFLNKMHPDLFCGNSRDICRAIEYHKGQKKVISSPFWSHICALMVSVVFNFILSSTSQFFSFPSFISSILFFSLLFFYLLSAPSMRVLRPSSFLRWDVMLSRDGKKGEKEPLAKIKLFSDFLNLRLSNFFIFCDVIHELGRYL